MQTVGSKVDPYEVQKQNKRRADKCLLPLLITTAQHTNETTFNDDNNKDEQTFYKYFAPNLKDGLTFQYFTFLPVYNYNL